MRVATWNVEWFTNLFDDHDTPLYDGGWSGRRDIRRAEQLEAIAIVLTALDADAIMVIEAPDTNGGRSTVRALENFADAAGLRQRKAVIGFPNDTQQEIALLYDPDVLSARHDPQGAAPGKAGLDQAPRFDGVFRLDLDGDAQPEPITFSKPPLELLVTPARGDPFRMIGVHTKSKAPHGARSDREALRLALANRRKQLAQCIWLRQRVVSHLRAGDSLVVLGDFNDGPGLDEYEKLFGHSGVEIVLGVDEPEDLRLFDANARLALSHKTGLQPVSARFWIAPERRYLNALLDYVMVSPDLRPRARGWRIWHPFDDPVIYNTPELREALLVASDHFPVSLELDVDQVNRTDAAPPGP